MQEDGDFTIVRKSDDGTRSTTCQKCGRCVEEKECTSGHHWRKVSRQRLVPHSSLDESLGCQVDKFNFETQCSTTRKLTCIDCESKRARRPKQANVRAPVRQPPNIGQTADGSISSSYRHLYGDCARALKEPHARARAAKCIASLRIGSAGAAVAAAAAAAAVPAAALPAAAAAASRTEYPERQSSPSS